MSQPLESTVDECLARLETGESIEAILVDYPHQVSELMPLLEMASRLKQISAQAPPVGALARTMARAQSKMHRSQPGWLRGFFAFPVMARAAALAAIAVLVLGSSVTIASDAVPGDWLYPLKRWTERARFTLTKNAENRAELRIEFASERLQEAVSNYQKDGILDDSLLKTMLREARLAVQETDKMPEQTKRRITKKAAAIATYQEETLKDLQTKAPAEVNQQLQTWVDMCQEQTQWMCGSPSVTAGGSPRPSTQPISPVGNAQLPSSAQPQQQPPVGQPLSNERREPTCTDGCNWD